MQLKIFHSPFSGKAEELKYKLNCYSLKSLFLLKNIPPNDILACPPRSKHKI